MAGGRKNPARKVLKMLGLKRSSTVTVDVAVDNEPDVARSVAKAAVDKAIASVAPTALKPVAEAAAVPAAAPAPAPHAVEEPELFDDNGEQTFELTVPDGVKPGSKLRIAIPGLAEKVVIPVPEGAVPGRIISFKLHKSNVLEVKAAINIQAVVRGKTARRMVAPTEVERVVPKAQAHRFESAARLDAPGAAAPGAAARAPGPRAPSGADAAAAAAAKAQAEREQSLALHEAEHEAQAGGWRASVSEAEAAHAEAEPPAPRGLRGLFKASGTAVLSALKFMATSSVADEPAVEPQAAEAAALGGAAAAAIAAWDAEDYAALAELCTPSVALALPAGRGEGMQGARALREGSHDGALSLDTIMAGVDDETGLTATVVGLQHCHDTAKHGMPTSHSWARLALVRADADGAPWRVAEICTEIIWPPPKGPDAPPEAMRLGLGRTCASAADPASLAAAALTAWLAGDCGRLQALLSSGAAVRIPALGIDAAGIDEVWAARPKLAALGSTVALNSCMLSVGADDAASLLCHAHLYDTKAAESTGRPTCHLAVSFELSLVRGGASAGWHLDSIAADVVWSQSPKPAPTQGLGFDSGGGPTSLYTRALVFVNAWEQGDAESIRDLAAAGVRLSVPRFGVDDEGIHALLEYRKTLGSGMGMLTVDSARVDEEACSFAGTLHEYGLQPNQHGLPLLHAGVRLGFERQAGAWLICEVGFEVQYKHATRRASSFSTVGEAVTAAAEL